jgi:hypothetical protein
MLFSQSRFAGARWPSFLGEMERDQSLKIPQSSLQKLRLEKHVYDKHVGSNQEKLLDGQKETG